MDNSLLGKMFEIGCSAKFIAKEFEASSMNLPINITMQRVIIYLKFHNNCWMSDVSGKIGLEKSSFSRLIENLVNLGYVKQNYDTDDRRRILLELTPAGVELSDYIHETMLTRVNEILSELTPAQLKKLESNLDSALSVIRLIKK